ncbi:hypothetical protein Tco_0312239 [Tanacetum coccineum]
MGKAKDKVFTLNLHHDGVFIPNPIRYVQGELKQITDINFECMSFNDLREIVRHLVLGTVKRLCYCPIKSDLNVGIKELKTDNDVKDFLRVGYENKWFVDLYIEHFDYDVLDFLNQVMSIIQLHYESSDEYYSSDEVEEFDYVDFHTEGEENVVIKNLTTQYPFLNKLCSNHGTFRGFIDEPIPIDQEPIEDPDDANISPLFKVKRGVSYPKHEPTIPWNKMQPILGMRNVEVGRCAGMYINKKNAVQKKLFDDDSSKSDKKSKPTKKPMSGKKGKPAKKATKLFDIVTPVKKGMPIKKGKPARKSVSFSPNVTTRSHNSGC